MADVIFHIIASGFLIGTKAVSYTHLDVYKRQGKMGVRVQNTPWKIEGGTGLAQG